MDVRQLEEKQLVKQLQRGDSQAFEEVLRRYTARVYSLAWRLTRNAQDSEESLQDTFVTVFRKIRSFEGKSSLSSWIYRITVNVALMKLRKRRSEKAFLLEDSLPSYRDHLSLSDPRSERSLSSFDLKSKIERAISELPFEYRAVFVLRDIDGLSTKEVCKVLGVSAPAIKSRLHRARLLLRRTLRDVADEHLVPKAA